MAIIEVTDLGKRYGDHVAVDGITFTVDEGEIFGILGPNGAGKTTTVECIEGLRTPDRGTITVDGLDPRRDRAKLRHRLGAQLQESELPERMKVWEALDLHSSFYREPADWRALLERLGPGGQARHRVQEALGRPAPAVVHRPGARGQSAHRGAGRAHDRARPPGAARHLERDRGDQERRVTVLLVTHFMEEAERLCDRLAVIDSGRVVAVDSPTGLVSRVDDEQRVRFRPSAPLDERLLADLPEVSSVRAVGGQVLVAGTGSLLHAVTSVLARNHVVAAELRVEQTSLDDAFVELTGRKIDD
jgi:ABC-2 type transport system ATP-binding protein